VLKGTTADISALSEFGWYDWVMYHEPTGSFPDDKFVLGRYLGPAIDVGSALTAKILNANAQCIFRSTLRCLTLEELESEHMLALRAKFDKGVELKIGAACSESDFDATDLTPEYSDDVSATAIASATPIPNGDDEEPTPEAGDNLVSAQVLLPRGDTLARGRVKCRKRDAHGNPTGRANANPILDTRSYLVEFDDGEITELAANVIAESMYAQCDPDDNEYLLLDSFLDYRKNASDLAKENEIAVINGFRCKRKSSAAHGRTCVI